VGKNDTATNLEKQHYGDEDGRLKITDKKVSFTVQSSQNYLRKTDIVYN